MHWRSFFKVFALSSFISAAVASLFLYPITEAGHVAAWVQAVGSIGAILAAIRIATRQTDRERAVAQDGAKMKLIFCEGAIYELHNALRDAAKATYEVDDLLMDPTTSDSPALDGHMGCVGENLDRAVSLFGRIEWDAFLVAMPEKAEFVRKTIAGLSYIGRISNTRGLAADEAERDRIQQTLVSFEALLENEDFLTLSDN